jgi:hypothetical protein
MGGRIRAECLIQSLAFQYLDPHRQIIQALLTRFTSSCSAATSPFVTCVSHMS